MKKSNKTSELSLGRTKIARLNSTQMEQIEGGNKTDTSVRGIPTSSWTCLTAIISSTMVCG